MTDATAANPGRGSCSVAVRCRSRVELLRLSSIGKRFPGVQALSDVDFDLRAGEVHVLFGENGAGKSTLINIIAGTFPPDEGTMELRGQPIRLHSPHHARQLGINAVFQEFSLVPTLSVQDNLYLGREHTRAGILDKAAIARGTQATLDAAAVPPRSEGAGRPPVARRAADGRDRQGDPG